MALPMMEKDFWVSWVLAAYFGGTNLGESLVFKGGTSLSKVARAIDRHAEAYRDLSTPMPERYARHYGDLAALARGPVGARALAQPELLVRVATWKSRFFAREWARYDLAVPGSLRLLPPSERLPSLTRDYDSMRVMHIVEPAPFAEVMETLAALEADINRSS